MKSNLTTILMIVTILSFLSCNNTNNSKQRELELKEKELLLKEKELKNLQKSNKNNELSNVENLIGYWYVPEFPSSAITLRLRFYRNGRFQFNDYNSTLGKEELLTGDYELLNGRLTLKYDDRPKQIFSFFKGRKGDDNYYIKNNSYYFVKGENGY